MSLVLGGTVMVKMADLVIRFGGCGGLQFWDKTFLRRVLLLISIKIRLTPLLRRGVLHNVMGGFGVQLIFQLFLLADGYIVAALRSVISGFVDGGFDYLLFNLFSNKLVVTLMLFSQFNRFVFETRSFTSDV